MNKLWLSFAMPKLSTSGGWLIRQLWQELEALFIMMLKIYFSMDEMQDLAHAAWALLRVVINFKTEGKLKNE